MSTTVILIGLLITFKINHSRLNLQTDKNTGMTFQLNFITKFQDTCEECVFFIGTTCLTALATLTGAVQFSAHLNE